MMVDDDACERFGLDPKAVTALARRLSRVGRDAQKMGLTIFGGSGSGTLRVTGEGGTRSIIADVDGSYDGGDGGDDF